MASACFIPKLLTVDKKVKITEILLIEKQNADLITKILMAGATLRYFLKVFMLGHYSFKLHKCRILS